MIVSLTRYGMQFHSQTNQNLHFNKKSIFFFFQLVLKRKICQSFKFIQKSYMQGAHQGLRNELWDRLKVIYDKYATTGGQIVTGRVQEIVRDVLGQTTQQQIDYVIKNMHRVDSDGSGAVSFLEFGNFLFKKHCGQISLQKMHKESKISRGSERKINLQEFKALLNNAYKFLGVKANEDFATGVFQQTDKDKDGYITFVQYFQFIQKYICQTTAQFSQYQKSPVKVKEPEVVSKPVDLGRQWNGRFRLYLWGQLRRLYEAYVLGKQITINDQNLRGLVIYLLGQLSNSDLTFILTGLYQLDRDNLQFLPFAIIFFSLVAQLGLSQFQRNHISTKKFLNSEQFINLLRNTYKFLSIGRVRRQILLLIFRKIDTNNDGLITFHQYLDWVKRYLCVDLNRGDQYYLKEDDEAIQGGDIFDSQSVLSVIPTTSIKNTKAIVLKFSNYDFSDQVRKRVWQLLVPFDVNKDQKFDESQIHTALTKLLRETQIQLAYVTRNVFRYDLDGDKNVTYDQLTNFCVQQHFGEMAIQRLHKVKTYVRGSQRIMNQAQFGVTLNNALSYIDMKVPPQLVSELFRELDLQKTGWISYQMYFLFLRYYFGSLRGHGSQVVKVQTDPDLDWWNSLSGLSAFERFVRILLDQLRNIFLRYDYNKNLQFQQDQIQAILRHVFGLNQNQVAFVLLKFFDFASRKNKSLQYDQLVRILLEIYFCQILLKRRFPDLQPNQWKTRKINLQQFIQLVLYACFFLRRKPSNGDLTQIFKVLDTDKDGYITFWQFIQFIKKYLGVGLKQFDEVEDVKPVVEVPKPPQISNEQWDFINAIWCELKEYFDRYDSGSKGYLTEADLRRFAIQVLKEETDRQLDYIFWNLFRVDPNSDKKTQFNQFAPFILNHAGEIALQRFHRQQVAGKNTLDNNQLFIVFSNAFSFLRTMPKSQAAVRSIYNRIGKGGDPNYASYLGWINRALANRFRK